MGADGEVIDRGGLDWFAYAARLLGLNRRCNRRDRAGECGARILVSKCGSRREQDWFDVVVAVFSSLRSMSVLTCADIYLPITSFLLLVCPTGHLVGFCVPLELSCYSLRRSSCPLIK